MPGAAPPSPGRNQSGSSNACVSRVAQGAIQKRCLVVAYHFLCFRETTGDKPNLNEPRFSSTKRMPTTAENETSETLTAHISPLFPRSPRLGSAGVAV